MPTMAPVVRAEVRAEHSADLSPEVAVVVAAGEIKHFSHTNDWENRGADCHCERLVPSSEGQSHKGLLSQHFEVSEVSRARGSMVSDSHTSDPDASIIGRWIQNVMDLH